MDRERSSEDPVTSLKTCSTCHLEYDAALEHCPHCDATAAAKAVKAGPMRRARAAFRRWFPVLPAAVVAVAYWIVPTVHVVLPGREFTPPVTLWRASLDTWAYAAEATISKVASTDFLLAFSPAIAAAAVIIIALTVIAHSVRKPAIGFVVALLSFGAFLWLNQIVIVSNNYLAVARDTYPIGGMVMGFSLIVLGLVAPYCLWPQHKD
jgi:hypothetical protein